MDVPAADGGDGGAVLADIGELVLVALTHALDFVLMYVPSL